MKCKILEKSGEMFLTYGFKSVTMDDIAKKMGISKKTIYTHFKNKTKLVEESSICIFNIITKGIDNICTPNKNPIEELYEIKSFVIKQLKEEKTSPHYQLQKYYPIIFKTLKLKKLEAMKDCVMDNIKRGVNQDLFRPEIDIEFIARIYFSGMTGLKDEDTFPQSKYSQADLMEGYLNYHIRAIATQKGIETLENLLIKNEK